MEWKISEAKQEFSKVVEASSAEPQWILNRDRRVAAVVSAEDAAAFFEWKRASAKPSLAHRLERLTQICQDTNYVFEPPERRDRANDFERDA